VHLYYIGGGLVVSHVNQNQVEVDQKDGTTGSIRCL